MTPAFRRVALVLAVLGFAVSVLVAACGDDEDESAPASIEAATTAESDTERLHWLRITVEGGRPVGGIARPSVSQGDKFSLVVRSDVADHVHVHGYDVIDDVGPGAPARITVVADVPGRFEIELEELGVQIAELQVTR